MPFVKIDCGIINSTIWLDRPAREVFLTALLLAEPHEITKPTPQLATASLDETGWIVPVGWYGFVPASGVGIIDRAKVPLEEGRAALNRLGQPELESRSPDFDGRRLVRIDGGFIVLNYMRYRERDYTSADRSRRYRQRKDASRRDVTVSRRDITQAEAEAEVDIQKADQGVASNGDRDKEIRVDHARSSSARARVNGSVWVEPHGNPHAAETNLVNGADLRRHGQHAWCAPDRPNLCIPHGFHTELKSAAQKTDAEMKAWYLATIAKFNGTPIGDDRFVFWRNELAGWIGTVTSVPPKRAKRQQENEQEIEKGRAKYLKGLEARRAAKR